MFSKAAVPSVIMAVPSVIMFLCLHSGTRVKIRSDVCKNANAVKIKVKKMHFFLIHILFRYTRSFLFSDAFSIDLCSQYGVAACLK